MNKIKLLFLIVLVINIIPIKQVSAKEGWSV